MATVSTITPKKVNTKDKVNIISSWMGEYKGELYVHMQQGPPDRKSKRFFYCWILEPDLEELIKALNIIVSNQKITDPIVIHKRANGYQLQIVRVSRKIDPNGDLFQLQVSHYENPETPIANIIIKDVKTFKDMINSLLNKWYC
jgi:hypothetical protein